MEPQVQQSQLAAILEADPAPFETLNSHPMSSSNEQRSQAELILEPDANTIMKKLCDTILELASSLFPDNGCPELLSFMFRCVSYDSFKLQKEMCFFDICSIVTVHWGEFESTYKAFSWGVLGVFNYVYDQLVEIQSISQEFIRFMKLIDEMYVESDVIELKKV
ncbi:hypothetical protein QVD17_30141 [Tagetes erecta]|uniref:Uncharacterized protein n=1 Tax=Tagetes erecta TaxID=13708 RepID=A0AAD8K1C9_TARER|nr:hypothetical protein QVD17_30141 [Tagetes erecta]